MDEHHALSTDQFEMSEDSVGKYVLFKGRVYKNVQGGLDHRKIELKCIQQYGDPDNPKCVLKLYERYFTAVESGKFYRRPLPTKPGEEPRFGLQTVGLNT